MMLGKTGGNSVEKSVDPPLKSRALAVENAGMFPWIAGGVSVWNFRPVPALFASRTSGH